MASFVVSMAARITSHQSLTSRLALAAAATAATTTTIWIHHEYNPTTNNAKISSANDPNTASCERRIRERRPPSPLLKTRLTSVGRFSILSETATNPSIPCLVLGLAGKPLTTEDFCQQYEQRGILERHPRFGARLDATNTYFVTPEPQRRASTASAASASPNDDVHHHVKETMFPMVYRNELKELIDEAITEPLNLLEGLWQVRIASGGSIGQSGVLSQGRCRQLQDVQQQQQQKQHGKDDLVESLLFFRAHHCMADGVSLGAIFTDLVDEAPEFHVKIKHLIQLYKKRKRSIWQRLQILIGYWWWGSIRAVLHQLNLYRHMLTTPSPWKVLERHYKDKIVQSSHPRKRTLSWCEITTLDEVKQVAKHFSNKHGRHRSSVTVNDVFASCVSAAIAKLLAFHRDTQPNLVLPPLSHMNLVMPVHMQGGILLPGQSLGNKIGALVCRIAAEQVGSSSNNKKEGGYRHMGPQSEDRLMQVHHQLTAMKETPAAFWSFVVAKMFGSMGTTLGGITPWLFSKAHANASAVLTNVRGPDQYVHLGGRRIQTTLGFLPLPPGIPIGVAVSSYAGNVTLSVAAEPWAVPDADLFLLWVVEEYESLLRQATVDQREKTQQPG
jgi:diacylglycerol O-acyltransferase / wax synthase